MKDLLKWSTTPSSLPISSKLWRICKDMVANIGGLEIDSIEMLTVCHRLVVLPQTYFILHQHAISNRRHCVAAELDEHQAFCGQVVVTNQKGSHRWSVRSCLETFFFFFFLSRTSFQSTPPPVYLSYFGLGWVGFISSFRIPTTTKPLCAKTLPRD